MPQYLSTYTPHIIVHGSHVEIQGVKLARALVDKVKTQTVLKSKQRNRADSYSDRSVVRKSTTGLDLSKKLLSRVHRMMKGLTKPHRAVQRGHLPLCMTILPYDRGRQAHQTCSSSTAHHHSHFQHPNLVEIRSHHRNRNVPMMSPQSTHCWRHLLLAICFAKLRQEGGMGESGKESDCSTVWTKHE